MSDSNAIIISILGAVFLIFTWWKIEKQRRDKDPKYAEKVTWKEFGVKNIDDAIYAIICGAIVGYFREDILNVTAFLTKYSIKEICRVYNGAEELFLFAAGYSGTFIVKGLLEGGSFTVKLVIDKGLGLLKKLFGK